MAFNIRTRIVEQPDIEGRLAEFTKGVPEPAGAAAERALSGSASRWPVDTGASKAGFGYERNGNEVEIVNREDYAVFVEARTGAAYETLKRALKRIAEQAGAAAGKVLR